jgi:hypothetical protein
MKMKNIYMGLACMALFGLTACNDDDNSIGTIEVPSTFYQLPQGGNTAADQRIQTLYDTYGSYFLYDFTEKDFNWAQTEAGLMDDSYQYEAIDPANVVDLLDILQYTWMDQLTTEEAKTLLPFAVMMTEKLQIYVSGWWSSYWSDTDIRYIDKQIAVARPEKTLAEMSSSEKLALRNRWLTALIYCAVNSGKITIPSEFQSVTDYNVKFDSWWPSAEDCRGAGFVYDYYEDSEWAADAWFFTYSADWMAYISSLVSMTEEDWADDLANYPLVKTKYNLLVKSLKEQGIDIVRIGNASK